MRALKNVDVVRALFDPSYRATLSADQQSRLPDAPRGAKVRDSSDGRAAGIDFEGAPGGDGSGVIGPDPNAFDDPELWGDPPADELADPALADAGFDDPELWGDPPVDELADPGMPEDYVGDVPEDLLDQADAFLLTSSLRNSEQPSLGPDLGHRRTTLLSWQRYRARGCYRTHSRLKQHPTGLPLS